METKIIFQTKNKAEVSEQNYYKLKTTLEMKQNTKTHANELAHQRQVTPDSNLNQDKHIHNTHCLDTTGCTKKNANY